MNLWRSPDWSALHLSTVFFMFSWATFLLFANPMVHPDTRSSPYFFSFLSFMRIGLDKPFEKHYFRLRTKQCLFWNDTLPLKDRRTDIKFALRTKNDFKLERWQKYGMGSIDYPTVQDDRYKAQVKKPLAWPAFVREYQEDTFLLLYINESYFQLKN